MFLDGLAISIKFVAALVARRGENGCHTDRDENAFGHSHGTC